MYWSSWFTRIKDCLKDLLKGLAERLLASLLLETSQDGNVKWLIRDKDLLVPMEFHHTTFRIMAINNGSNTSTNNYRIDSLVT